MEANHAQIPSERLRVLKATLLATHLKEIYKSYNNGDKIDYVPGRCGEFFGFSALYDWAVDNDKMDLGHSDEVKKALWKSAKIAAQNWFIRNKVELSEERLKNIATKNYKSELIYKYLVDKYNNTGVRMNIEWDSGEIAKTWEELLNR